MTTDGLPTAVMDAEIAAARAAGDTARADRLEAGKRLVEELARWIHADPALGGLALDALPRVPAAVTG